MMNTPPNWVTVTESQYIWEREALAFVRDRFPNHEPYRAWSNFEFGSINEVDLLVCTPHADIEQPQGFLIKNLLKFQYNRV